MTHRCFCVMPRSGVLRVGHLREGVRLHPDPNRHVLPNVVRALGQPFPKAMQVLGFVPLTHEPVPELGQLLLRPTKIKPSPQADAGSQFMDSDPAFERGLTQLLAASLHKVRCSDCVRRARPAMCSARHLGSPFDHTYAGCLAKTIT